VTSIRGSDSVAGPEYIWAFTNAGPNPQFSDSLYFFSGVQNPNRQYGKNYPSTG